MKNKITILLSMMIFLSACSLESNSSSTDDEINSPAESQTEKVEEKADENRVVSFYGVGDNLIHSYIYEEALTEDGSYDFTPMYENLQGEIQEADLAYINQETLIGGDELGFSGYPTFNTPEDMRQSLVDTGFDLVSGSNNHTMDRGGAAAQHSLDLWKEYEDEILFTGIFESQEDRDDFPVFEKNGMTFSFLTYTYGTNGIPLDQPYRTNLIDEELIKADVERAQEMSDFVVVAMHWGNENTYELNVDQTHYSQLLADLEVDVVVGTHSHNLQPVEWVRGQNGNETLVTYSLGNFIASPYMDMNSFGGAIQFDFIQENEDYYIDNVVLQPIVIHYDNTTGTRANFKLYNLQDYPEELAVLHGHGLDHSYFYTTVDQVIDDGFLSAPVLEGIEKYSTEPAAADQAA
ncbi:MAG: CapA family protein [Atopococcus tabaci]|uniref:CapA family protein n=1 Tax=Atopococcus tabaci TaxID=269774 RepID=A0AA43UD08_9LACT|nr:CapA family protein [Atopococcus tabaci]